MYIELHFHPRHKNHLIMVYDPSSILWSSTWPSLLRIFTPNSHQKYWPVVSFFRLWHQGNAGLIHLGLFTPPKFSGRGWEELALVHCYMFGRIHQWSHLFTVFGSYMITDSLLTCLLKFSVGMIQSWWAALGSLTQPHHPFPKPLSSLWSCLVTQLCPTPCDPKVLSLSLTRLWIV